MTSGAKVMKASQMKSWRQNTEQELKFCDLLLTDPEMAALEKEKCRRDPIHWLENWVWTLDAHDSIEPVRRFPKRDYLRRLTQIWQNEKLLLIPKSRQMMVSWLITALYLHDAQFNPGRFIFFQSKKEKDADSLVDRAKFIYNNQPWFLREPAKQVYCELAFPRINSVIRGIPQGGNQIRMHTASGIFMDEAAFMYEADEAFTAAKPSIDGGGRITMASSANPGFFEMLVNDRIV